MKNILITGATGNIGSQLINNLSDQNIKLTVMLRNEESSKAAAFNAANIKVVYGDFADKASLKNAVADIEIAYLLIPSVPNMAELATNFIEVARQANVSRIVKQSVLGADVNAQVDIPKFHGLSDEALKNSGIQYTILQPNSFMQNFIGSAASIKEQNALYLNYADGKFSTVDVRDIAASTAAAIIGNGHENKVYAITGPAAVGVKDFTDSLSKSLNQEIKYIAIPDDAAKQAMLGMGINEWFVDNLVGFGKIISNNWAAYVSDDVEKLTGKKAISINQFAQDFAMYFK